MAHAPHWLKMFLGRTSLHRHTFVVLHDLTFFPFYFDLTFTVFFLSSVLMHPEHYTDLDNLHTVENNLLHSAKGSNDAYDVTHSLTGYEPNDTVVNELVNSQGSFSYITPSSDLDVDDTTLGKLLTEAHREYADYRSPEGVSVSQSSLSVVFDRTGKPVGERNIDQSIGFGVTRNTYSAHSKFSENTQAEKMVDRTGKPEERDSSNAQIRTLFEEQRQMIIAEYRGKVDHHELQAAHAEEERRILREELWRKARAVTSEKTGITGPFSYGLTQASYLQLSVRAFAAQKFGQTRCGGVHRSSGGNHPALRQLLSHSNPVVEYTSPPPAALAAPALVLEYIALAPAVSYTAPAPPTMTVAGRRLELQQQCPQFGFGSICVVWRTIEVHVTGTHDDGYWCRHEARRHSRCAATAPIQVHCMKYVSPAPAVSTASPALTVFAAPSLVVEYISPASAVSYFAPAPAGYAAPAPVVEYIGPVQTVSYSAPASVVEHISPSRAVYGAPALVVKYISPR